MKRILDIIIPTYDNYTYLEPCISSILATKKSDNLFNIYVVNNGHKNSCDWIKSRGDYKDITVLQPGKNLGWEGGINYGINHSKSPLILFMNDDTFVPKSSFAWLYQLSSQFEDPKVGAVGCSSNVVLGLQNIFYHTARPVFDVKYLIGFCLMTKREVLEKVGNLDESLPGGDDIDLSIRLRNLDYKLKVNKLVFVYHHGFKTGEKLRGKSDKVNGWNSYQMQVNTNTALIRKHGFKSWIETFLMQEIPEKQNSNKDDNEGNYIRNKMGKGRYLDLGCGFRKTRKDVIAIDMIPKGKVIDSLNNISVADVVADLNKKLPFEDNSQDGIVARHILEHLIDTVRTLMDWHRVLKPKGIIFIAVPNEDLYRSIPMNVEHVHAFTMESLSLLMQLVGFKIKEICDPRNDISFIIMAEKV